jgi:molybdopterin-binding protein
LQVAGQALPEVPAKPSSAHRSPEIQELIMLSARNQLAGTVKSVKLGAVMAEVVVTVGAIEMVSLITRTSAETLNLQAGDKVKAVIKSTEVLIDK